MFPSRYVNVEAARVRFGSRVHRFGHFFLKSDDPADAAAAELCELPPAERERVLGQALSLHRLHQLPPAVRALFEQLSELPYWADLERATRGGGAMIPRGPVGMLVLSHRSLIAGYCSPAGNKPLAFSGRLKESAVRRLAETGRFVEHVYQPGGLKPRAHGWAAAIRVRLMHAQVRRLLLASPRWNTAEWGLPINQADLASTQLLFSWVLVEGMRALGLQVSREEVEDLLHLWRVTGWLMGVDPELVCVTEAEADAQSQLIIATQMPPDADSAALARALIESSVTSAPDERSREVARLFLPVSYAFSRFLIGSARADALGFPSNPLLLGAPALKQLVRAGDTMLRAMPGAGRLRLELGYRYWHHAIEQNLKNHDASFAMPERVRHA